MNLLQSDFYRIHNNTPGAGCALGVVVCSRIGRWVLDLELHGEREGKAPFLCSERNKACVIFISEA